MLFSLTLKITSLPVSYVLYQEKWRETNINQPVHDPVAQVLLLWGGNVDLIGEILGGPTQPALCDTSVCHINKRILDIYIASRSPNKSVYEISCSI